MLALIFFLTALAASVTETALLDPALDDLRVVNKAMKDVEKLLSELEKE